MSRDWMKSILGNAAMAIISVTLAMGAILFIVGVVTPSVEQTTTRAYSAAGRHYAAKLVRECPPVAGRALSMLQEPLAKEQIVVLDTLVEQVRSRPDGIGSCPVEPLHPDRSAGVMITGA